MDFEYLNNAEKNKLRIDDLIKIIPKNRTSLLDIGAGNGDITLRLKPYFKFITALDLEKPDINSERIVAAEGDVTQLVYPDNCFDVVVCAEVLEHIASEKLKKACGEIIRVAKDNVVVGVPFEQDIRVGRTTCIFCGKKNPPWGHINTFDENRIRELFQELKHVKTTFVGKMTARTNIFSTFFMDLGRNPWGTYDQKEPCIYCGKKLIRLNDRNLSQKVCTKLAYHLNMLQKKVVKPKPIWMHMLLEK